MKQDALKHYAYVLPDAKATELLHLAFDDTFDPDHFLKWTAGYDIDDADDGIMRLLPMLYPNLRDAGVDHPYVPRIAGIHRHTTYRNQLLMHRGIDLVAKLNAAGIDAMLLKGAALLCLDGFDLGSRPMADFDLLVPENTELSDVEQVALTDLIEPLLTERKTNRYLAMTNGKGFEFDVHLHLKTHTVFSGSTDLLWQDAKTTEWKGTACKVPSYEHLAFGVLVHGMGYNLVSPIRWVSDFMAVLSAAECFDWDKVAELSNLYRSNEAVSVALWYLVENGFGGDVVERGFEVMSAQSDLWRDSFFMRQTAKPPKQRDRSRAFRLLVDYDRMMRLRDQARTPRSFNGFLYERFGVRGLGGAFSLVSSRLGPKPKDT